MLFAIGDVVELKSGSPRMVVTNSSEDSVSLSLFFGGQILNVGPIRPECLVIVNA